MTVGKLTGRYSYTTSTSTDARSNKANQDIHQPSGESSDTTDMEDDMLTCTTLQSQTYGSIIAPFVHFKNLAHRVLFGVADAQESTVDSTRALRTRLKKKKS